MTEPDTASEHMDFLAGETSMLEGQQGFHSGLAHSTVQVGGGGVGDRAGTL